MSKNEKFRAVSFEKLNDDLLECVSGGVDPQTVGSTLLWTAFGSACVSLGSSIVSTVVKYRAKSEKKHGDKASAARLKKISNTFHDISVGGMGLCAISAGGLGAMEIIHRSGLDIKTKLFG